jgi:apolipoprotein N-acyltransferase
MPGPRPDIVVWSEAGFPVDIRYARREDMKHSDWATLAEEFLAYQADMGTWLVTGVQDHVSQKTAYGVEHLRNYNASFLIDPQGAIRGFYHKMHLVPFTEHFPLDKERFSGLYELFQKYDISNWERGTERLIFEHDRFRFYSTVTSSA